MSGEGRKKYLHKQTETQRIYFDSRGFGPPSAQMLFIWIFHHRHWGFLMQWCPNVVAVGGFLGLFLVCLFACFFKDLLEGSNTKESWERELTCDGLLVTGSPLRPKIEPRGNSGSCWKTWQRLMYLLFGLITHAKLPDIVMEFCVTWWH